MNKKTKIILISVIVIIFALIITWFIRHSYALTFLDSGTSSLPVTNGQYQNLPKNHVQINELKIEDAQFTTTNNQFELVDNTNGQISGVGEGSGIYYHGPVTYGTANRTSTADAVTATNNISGSFSLLFTDGATLSDGKSANVKITISDIYFELGANTGVQTSTPYIILMKDYDGTFEYKTSAPSITPENGTTAANTTGADIGTKYKVTIEILDKETNSPISSDYEQMLYGTYDVDLFDKLVAGNKTRVEKFDGEYSESVILKSGFAGPVALAPNTSDPLNTNFLKTQNANGDLRILGDGAKYQANVDAGGSGGDVNTFNSGFIVPVNPQGFSFYWNASSVATGEAGTSVYTLPKPKVLASAGANGTIEKPGTTEYVLNTSTTYKYTPAVGYKVKSLKVNGQDVQFNEKGGTYTFDKLYKDPLSTSTTPEYTIEVQFEKKLEVDVTFLKEDPDGGPITGAKFRLWGTADNGDTVDMTATSQNGKVTFANVPIGEYSLKETEEAPGYKLDTKTYTVKAGERNA